MTLIQAIILGIVQGLTEFLPVSSSAHLVLVPFLFNWILPAEQAFIFAVLVQLGTLVAVIVYFWKDLITIFKAFFIGIKNKQPFSDKDSRLGWMTILATFPAGLAGVLLKDKVEAAFDNPVATAIFLLLTASLLVAVELWTRKVRSLDSITSKDAFIIGLFQAAAIFPGVSRSGSTISGGLIRGFRRQAAARFSFLLSIPVMLAAGFLAFIDLIQMPLLTSFLPIIIVGFIASAIVGYLSIKWFLSYLKRNSLFPFAIYCAVVSIMTIFVAYAR